MWEPASDWDKCGVGRPTAAAVFKLFVTVAYAGLMSVVPCS